MLLEDDGTGTDETDTRYHLCCDARHVEAVVLGGEHALEAMSREYHE